MKSLILLCALIVTLAGCSTSSQTSKEDHSTITETWREATVKVPPSNAEGELRGYWKWREEHGIQKIIDHKAPEPTLPFSLTNETGDTTARGTVDLNTGKVKARLTPTPVKTVEHEKVTKNDISEDKKSETKSDVSSTFRWIGICVISLIVLVLVVKFFIMPKFKL